MKSYWKDFTGFILPYLNSQTYTFPAASARCLPSGLHDILIFEPGGFDMPLNSSTKFMDYESKAKNSMVSFPSILHARILF
jgi:hypothetical protein